MRIGVAVRLLVVMTLLLGGIYPALVWVGGRLLFQDQAAGSLVKNEKNEVIGSSLIGQKFNSEIYFWGRPSASDYSGATSGGTNLGPTSQSLLKEVEEREKYLREKHPAEEAGRIPDELLFASGSGLDPHIAPDTARFQLKRVIQARKFSKKQAYDLTEAIEKLTEQPQWEVLGEARINLLRLNQELDRIASQNY